MEPDTYGIMDPRTYEDAIEGLCREIADDPLWESDFYVLFVRDGFRGEKVLLHIVSQLMDIRYHLSGWEYMAKLSILGLTISRRYLYTARIACQDLVTLSVEKHIEHGTNLLKHGETGVRIRIDDKIARLRQIFLSGRGSNAIPESNPWIDISGYSLQMILISRGHYTLPMR